MGNSIFRNISELSCSLCTACFSGDNVNTETNINCLNEMTEIVKRQKDNDNVAELLYVFIERGAETAFLNHATDIINKGGSATEKVTSENELESFLNVLKHKCNDESSKDVVDKICYHINIKIDNLATEMSNISLQSFNRVDKTYKANESSLKARLDSFNKQIESINEKLTNTSKEMISTKRAMIKTTKESKSILNNTISVLGLFMTIAAAVFGGISITNEVLKTISTNMFTSILFVLVTSFILINIIFLFVFLIAKMSGSDIGMQCQGFVIDKKSIEEKYAVTDAKEVFIQENLYELHNCLFCTENCGFAKKLQHRYPYMVYIDVVLSALIIIFGLIWAIKNTFYVSWINLFGEVEVKKFLIVIFLCVIGCLVSALPYLIGQSKDVPKHLKRFSVLAFIVFIMAILLVVLHLNQIWIF